MTMPIDEGPSHDDIDRFSGDTGYCPECGTEIWDQADRCPECGAWLAGGPRPRPPIEEFLRNRWIALVAIAALVAFLIVVLL